MALVPRDLMIVQNRGPSSTSMASGTRGVAERSEDVSELCPEDSRFAGKRKERGMMVLRVIPPRIH